MRKLFIVLSAALLASAACRDRARDMTDDDIELRKPVESTIDEAAERTAEPVPPPAVPAPSPKGPMTPPSAQAPGEVPPRPVPSAGETAEPTVSADDDFLQTRTTFRTTMRERLSRLDERLERLEDRTDAEARDAAARLRATRDELSSRIETIDDRAESGWDEFRSDVSRSFDQLERNVDAALE